MIKLIIFIVIMYILYKVFWKKSPIITSQSNTTYDENDLIECSNCHTFVPKNECKFTSNGCLCKDCQ
jgi:hypothetical protein